VNHVEMCGMSPPLVIRLQNLLALLGAWPVRPARTPSPWPAGFSPFNISDRKIHLDAARNFKSGAVNYESIEVRDTKIRAYGNTAIVDSLVSVQMITSGKPVRGDFRATSVCVKQNGNWKRVAFQSMRFAPGGR
jgi:Domain of unknown function (DUF4440)